MVADEAAKDTVCVGRIQVDYQFFPFRDIFFSAIYEDQ